MSKKVWAGAGLLFFTLAISLLTICYRLPADRLIAAALDRYSHGRLFFKVQKVSYLPPASYRMDEGSCGIRLRDSLIKDGFDSLRLSPDYGALFRGYLPLKIEADMSRGVIETSAGVSFKGGMKAGYLSTGFDGLYLEDFNILRAFSGRNLSGKLKGDVHAKGNFTDLSKISGEGDFVILNGAIDTRIEIRGMEKVPFNTFRLAFSLKDGKMILKDTEMKGPLFSGRFSGEIRLQNMIAQSRLSLKGELVLGPEANRNEFVSQFLEKIRKTNKGPLIVRIEGSLERPSIFWSRD